jgi:hypothetical protein
MSFIGHFSRHSVLVIIICSFPATAAPEITAVAAKIKILNDYLIVVPVLINDAGPYDFVLDTGSNNTMIDQKLANELALRRGDEAAVVKIWASVTTSAVYADSLSIAGATVAGKYLNLFSAKLSGLPSKVRGVLGEDFLEKFDVLIDYDHQVIRLEECPGPTLNTLRGERLPIELNGAVSGESTSRRIIVKGRVGDLGDGSISLLLDSGSRHLVLFRDDLGMRVEQKTFIDSSRPRSSNVTLKTITARSLSLGRSEVREITVVALGSQRRPDADGLVPTSFFHSIFISHQGRFVILNPSFAKLSH